MDQETYANLELERADRLVEFVKGETEKMYLQARIQFVQKLFPFLRQEVDEVLRRMQKEI